MKKLTIFQCIVVMLLLASGAIAQKKVLVIESYHPDLTWVSQCEKGITGVLGSEYQIHFFYMDTKRLPEREFQKRADAAWKKYLEIRPDLVMIGDDNGLRLLGPQLAETGTPTVYFGINNNPRNYFAGSKLPKNITGVLEHLPVFPWVRYLKKIMPGSKKALVLLDSSPTTDAILNVTFKERQSVGFGGIVAEYKIAGNWTQWKETIKNAKPYDMIIIPTFHALKDDRGDSVSFKHVVEWTWANSQAPVFSHQDYTVGPRGAVGAYVVYGQAHGRLAGEIALDILSGEKRPEEIGHIMDREGKFYFNQHQLDRFDLVLPEKIRNQAKFK